MSRNRLSTADVREAGVVKPGSEPAEVRLLLGDLDLGLEDPVVAEGGEAFG
jgi:hypothetical protein